MENLLLSILTFLPFTAACVLLIFAAGDDDLTQRNARRLGLFSSCITVLVCAFVFLKFDFQFAGSQLVESFKWIFGLRYSMGIDGISLLFIMLTAVIMPIIMTTNLEIKKLTKEHVALLLILQTNIIGAFSANDLILFYFFSESALIPIFILIGMWKNEKIDFNPNGVLTQFLLSSIILLFGVIIIVAEVGSSNIDVITNHEFSNYAILGGQYSVSLGLQDLTFILFCLGYFLKLSIFPFHYLSVQLFKVASTSFLLLYFVLYSKISIFAFVKLALPMFPEAIERFSLALLVYLAIGALYAAIASLAQKEMRSLLAYFANFAAIIMLMALFTYSHIGVEAAVFATVSHSLTLLGFILCVSFLEKHTGAHEFEAYGGLSYRMPILHFIFAFLTFASFGLPGTAGFVGLTTLFFSIFLASKFIFVLISISFILIVVALLSFYRQVFLGDLIKESMKKLKDLSFVEILCLGGVVYLLITFGLVPSLITDLIHNSVEGLLLNFEKGGALSEELVQNPHMPQSQISKQN